MFQVRVGKEPSMTYELNAISNENPCKQQKNPTAVAFTSEIVFTSHSDFKPFLAAFDCDTSIALAGYDPNNKIGFLANLSCPEDLNQNGEKIWRVFSRFIKKTPSFPIQLHLRGGIKGASERIVAAIYQWQKIWEKRYPTKVISAEILGNHLPCGKIDLVRDSLLLNTKNREVSSYNPLKDSDDYNLSLLERAIRLNYMKRLAISTVSKGILMVAYTPQEQIAARL